jgi:PEGA domain-containing protein
MALRTLMTALALTAIVAAPAPTSAQEGQRRRQRDDGGQTRQGARPSEQAPAARERAVPRAVEPQREEQARRDEQNRRDDQNRREQQTRRDEQIRRENQARRDYQDRRQYDSRQYDSRQYDSRQYDSRQYDSRQYDSRQYDSRQYDSRRYDNRRYDSRRFGYTPRIFRPTIVRVIPYRPYVYRPSYSLGVYYGSGGSYPYGYTPRGYYDPIPGRYYGGVRITGAPREARVFADGYYVGIVNDFDGIFQHMNLEAGPHHIEIDLNGYDGISFDVYVRPGETTTFRADGAFGRY